VITLRSDNRVLALNAKYSFLIDNYSSGSSTIYVTNTEGIEEDSFILIGEFGQETAEIFKCGTVTPSTGAVILETKDGAPATTVYAHAESTRVYVLPYNQIRFFWTAPTGTIADENPVFDSSTPLTSWVDLEPGHWYTTYEDGSNSDGFGWFVYKNSITTESSQESNPIPYAGFSYNTVANIFEDFDSLLNVNELKLVSIGDKFAWLNEAIALIVNKLNLTNTEYLVSSTKTINVVAGTPEYQLEQDFSDMVEIVDSSGRPIPYMHIQEAMTNQGTVPHYYLRGRYIGFTPTPEADIVYSYRYRPRSSVITSLSTYIDLPDNAFYSLKDWMMYRACLKFNNPMSDTYYQSFSNSVNLYIQSAIKRDSALDTWTIARESNT
jgi:hypothetical protein